MIAPRHLLSPHLCRAFYNTARAGAGHYTDACALPNLRRCQVSAERVVTGESRRVVVREGFTYSGEGQPSKEERSATQWKELAP